MTPRQGRHDGPVCRLEIFEPWLPALKGIDFYSNLEVLYWLHLSRRDLVLQSPKNNKSTRGTFSLRSPVRPNPIGTSIVKLVGVEGSTVLVRGLDCLDETPLLDLKPDRCEFTPAGAAAGRGISRRSDVPQAFNAAISFAAFSSSTLPSSLRLAGGSRPRRRGAASHACAGETPPVRRRVR